MPHPPSSRSMVMGVGVAVIALLAVIALVFLIGTARNKAARPLGAEAAHPQVIPGAPSKRM